jgi:hypothetical protein
MHRGSRGGLGCAKAMGFATQPSFAWRGSDETLEGAMVDIPIAVLMCRWKTTSSNANLSLAPWTQEVLQEVFQARNGWSLGSYWDDCSLGLRSPKFDFFDAGTLDATQETIDRGHLIPRVVDHARSLGVPVDNYQHRIAFMSPPPNPSGAIGTDDGAVLDRDGTLQYYAHELGHVLGLDHVFGYDERNIGVVYEDDYCIMGNFIRWFAFPNPNPAPNVANALTSSLWRSGPMPAAATLWKYWPDFRNSNRVRTVTPGTNGDFTLTALSAHALGGVVLIRIPVGTDQEYLLEYRTPTGWDQAFSEPVLVVHSHGLPSNHTPKREGFGMIWLVKAIPAPFHDAWSLTIPSISAEVVGVWSEDKAITIRIASPASPKSARLVERLHRNVVGSSVVDQGMVWLSRDNDRSLCDATGKMYGFQIERYGEEVHVDLQLDGFQQPVIERWTLNSQDILPNVGWLRFGRSVEATATVLTGTPPIMPHLVTQTRSVTATLKVSPLPDGVLVESFAGPGSYMVLLEVTVRDAALPVGVPAAIRTGSALIQFDGERVTFDEQYQHDAEACWLWRIHKRDRYLPVFRPGPPQPLPWIDRTDKQFIRRLEERVLERGTLKLSVTSSSTDLERSPTRGGGLGEP